MKSESLTNTSKPPRLRIALKDVNQTDFAIAMKQRTGRKIGEQPMQVDSRRNTANEAGELNHD